MMRADAGLPSIVNAALKGGLHPALKGGLHPALALKGGRHRRIFSWGGVNGLVIAVLVFSVASDGRASDPPSAEARDALRLVDSRDPYQRQLGFLRLEALREPSTVPLIRQFVDSRDADTRALSVRALAAVEGLGAVDRVLEVLERDRHPRVRRAAILGLEPFQRHNPRILPAFLKALRDRSTEVRMTAADVISRIDDPRAREAILTRLRRERRRDVQRVLRDAAQRLGAS